MPQAGAGEGALRETEWPHLSEIPPARMECNRNTPGKIHLSMRDQPPGAGDPGAHRREAEPGNAGVGFPHRGADIFREGGPPDNGGSPSSSGIRPRAALPAISVVAGTTHKEFWVPDQAVRKLGRIPRPDQGSG